MILPRFYLWILFLILSWVGLHFAQWNWGTFLLVFLILTPVLSWISLLLRKRSLHWQLVAHTPLVERGERASWGILCQNQSLIGRSKITLTCWDESGNIIEYGDLLGGKLKEKTYCLELVTRHTGPIKPPRFVVRLEDAFGFFSVPLKSLKEEGFPEILALPLSLSTELMKGESAQVVEAGEDTSKKSDVDLDEIDRMRPMQPGDPMRSIHWKLSARLQNWMVRVYEKADEESLTILMDLPECTGIKNTDIDYQMTRRDRILDRVSMDCDALLTQGTHLQLKLRFPWLEIADYRQPNEMSALRIRLASLPFYKTVSLSDQIAEELSTGTTHYYALFTDHLNQTLCQQILELVSRSQGVMVEFTPYANPIDPQSRKLLQDLRSSGIKVNEGGHLE